MKFERRAGSKTRASIHSLVTPNRTLWRRGGVNGKLAGPLGRQTGSAKREATGDEEIGLVFSLGVVVE